MTNSDNFQIYKKNYAFNTKNGTINDILKDNNIGAKIDLWKQQQPIRIQRK